MGVEVAAEAIPLLGVHHHKRTALVAVEARREVTERHALPPLLPFIPWRGWGDACGAASITMPLLLGVISGHLCCPVPARAFWFDFKDAHSEWGPTGHSRVPSTWFITIFQPRHLGLSGRVPTVAEC